MSRTAITGALLVDGTGAAPVPGSTVLWEGDTIIAVGPDGDVDVSGATRIDAIGGTVVPGLIDAHVHLCLEPTPSGVETIATDPVAQLAIRSTQAAKRLHNAGITVARDQGSRAGVAIDVAAAQRSGWLIGARILAAGRGVTPSGGHGWMIGVEADGPEAVAAAVRGEIERGADVVKIFPTGGVLGSGAHGFVPTMSLEEVAAAVAVAHDRGRLIGAHVHGAEGVALCLEAGVDTIEHGTAATPEQARQMAAQGVALVPTLAAVDALLGRPDEFPPDVLVRANEVWALARQSTADAIAAGVRVLAGTDAGTPFNPPGNLARELALLAELGLGPMGALVAATSAPAATFGLDDLGIIAAGMRADAVLLRGSPLDDLDELRTPRAVVQDGKALVMP